MANVDDKVVAMSFESSKFESGVNKTLTALDKLKAALKFPGAGKGLDDINASAKKVDLGHISKGVDEIKGKLSALSVAALAVFAQIAQRAVAAGTQFIKAFTLDPIIAGFHEYATNLNAIQTILANTQVSGATLKDVNAALQDLNEYSDKTIYNFSQMAKNIGTFTAAGVDLDTSTQAIKGIANLAALSGSNADQAATAMYQLSQAISAGSVKLQDWNSVVNAGMGGTVFQRALAQTAVAMGTLNQNAVKLTGPMKNVAINGEAFRQSLSTPGKASWLTSKVLTETLKQFTGDLSDAQLAAMGFNQQQITAIQQTAKTAMHAATEVKTLSQVFDVAKETAGSGWAQTFQIIFGNFTEAKTTFTALSNTINGFINTNAEARNKVLADWKALGGRTVLINTIKTAFHNLGEVVKPIKQAFRDIFPATTGKQLYDLTVRFQQFVKTLKPSPETIDALRRTFRGLFALLDIGKQIIGGIFTVFGQLFGVVGQNTGGFLDITASIGDFLVSIDEALKKGGRLHNFFVGIGSILSVPLRLLGLFRELLLNLFVGFSPGGFSDQMGGMANALTPFQKALEDIKQSWNDFVRGFGDIGRTLQPAIDAIVQLLQGLGPALNQAVTNMNFEAILQVIRTGLLGGIFLMFKNFFGKGTLLDQVSKGFGKGILGNISGSFRALQGSMQALQTNIKAKTLKEIAIAVALLTASVVALSFVNPARLTGALAAMTVGFGQLLGTMVVLETITKTTGFIKLPVITASLILLAGAIDLLSVAVVTLSLLSWEQLLKGLGAVGVLLTGITLAAGPLGRSSAGLITAGVGITALAVGLNVLALAVRNFGSMSLAQLGKGMASIAVGLVIIAGAMKLMPPGMILTGAGLIAVAVGLRIIGNVVAKFGEMNWGTIGKGIAAIAGALVVIAGAMQLMPANMVLTAAGLLLVSVALRGIAGAVESMGGMSVGQIAKGLISLALSLTILAAAMILMQGSMGGAVALGIAAAGLALLAPALVILGRQSWTQIVKGLAALAGVFLLIGAAGLLLGPVVPALLGFGVALVLIGGGLALAGAGLFLIGTALSALVVAAPTGVAVLVQAFVDLVRGVTENAKLLVLGILEIAKALANTAPQFVDALVKILNSLVDAVIKLSPKIAEAMTVLLTAALSVIASNQGKIIQAGFSLILALLQGIKNNISQVVTAVVDIVIKMLAAIVGQLSRIQRAGFNIVVSLVKGIVSNYTALVKAALELATKFISAIISVYGKVISAAVGLVTHIVRTIASNLGKIIAAGVSIVTSLITGIGNAGAAITTAGVNAMIKFIKALTTGALRLVNAGAQAVIKFLNGVADAIDQYEPQIIVAGARIGEALVTGMIKGMADLAPSLMRKVGDLAGGAVSKAKHILHIGSPSKIFEDIGNNIVRGLSKGISDNSGDSANAAEEMSKNVIDTVKTAFQITSPSKVMRDIGKEVGRGFTQGLKGSTDDIKKAFADLNSKLVDAMSNSRKTIAEEQAKLRELRQADKRDAGAIREARSIIAQNQGILARATAGHTALNKTLRKNKNELLGLSKQYADLAVKLDLAKTALDDATKKRDDALASFKDQYGALPEILKEDASGQPIDQLAIYTQALTNQIAAEQSYKATLEQLRTLGLDDKTYEKLVTEGTVDQAFANQLLAGGKTAVDSLNALDKQLASVSTTLATEAASNLYQAGVDAAQGLVNGFIASEAAIVAEMEKIATKIVQTIKRKLKIHSPSEVFAELGRLTSEGMAKGLADSSKVVTDAVETVANNAIETMRNSLSDFPFDELINMEPVITPILDLTAVQEGAARMAGIIPTTPIVAPASFGQAAAISSAQTATQAEQIAAATGPSFKFEQNNYSPEALTEIEIYRQTRNQLSQIRSALAST